MKITQKEISLITDAIVTQVYDDAKINQQIQKAKDDALNEFSKSKKWKDTIKLLKAWRNIVWFNWIYVKDKEFFSLKQLSYWVDCKITSEEDAKYKYINWIAPSITRQFPDRYMIKQKVQTLLTIKVLCGKDMEAIMNEIIATVKKEFKL